MIQQTLNAMAPIGITLVLFFTIYELVTGKYQKGKKSKEDWMMAGICLGALAFIQRPLLVAAVFFIMNTFFPNHGGQFNWIDQQFLWPGVVLFIIVDEFFHGGSHFFAHLPRTRYKFINRIQSFLKTAHRPHHLNAANDGRGEISVTQTYVEGWGWAFILPNYILALVVLYLGMYDIFLIGTVIKSTWALHNHCNWNYDLYFLNHKYKFVRKIMYGLCHIFTFPTMHQQHHSRSKNSAKNMQNMLSIYDWLFWKTLVIENERPKIFGWRQGEAEENNVLHRFFDTSFKAN